MYRDWETAPLENAFMGGVRLSDMIEIIEAWKLYRAIFNPCIYYCLDFRWYRGTEYPELPAMRTQQPFQGRYRK